MRSRSLSVRRRRLLPTAVPLFLLAAFSLALVPDEATPPQVAEGGNFSTRWSLTDAPGGQETAIPAAAIHAAFLRSDPGSDDAATRLRRSYGLAPVLVPAAHPFRYDAPEQPQRLAFAGQIGTQPRTVPETAVASADPVTTGSIPEEAAPEILPPTEEAGTMVTALVDPNSGAATLPGQRQISAFLDDARQFECLATGIYFEARGEPVRGQVAVAQVIMNRVRHEEFPNTICGVVYQNRHWRNRCQFSFACDGIRDRILSPAAWETARSVARQVLSGEAHIASLERSTHYHANYVRPRWARRMVRLDRIGAHIFYRGRYGGWR
ncbi:MAG: cell wall hydrolase [Hyphomicrobiaceae bacterium]|nr:cell wall hydrolase [Hyphomicrobiaceae bacterium]